MAALDVIVNEMGWSRAYARAVLAAWKKRTAYCRAVLTYPTRFRLDGSKTDEPVDDIARDDARRDIASNQQRKLAREAQAAARKEPAEKPAAREESIPKPEPPKAYCPHELIEGLNLEEEDRIRFRLRVFRHFQHLAPETLIDEAFAITSERLPRSAATAAVCKTIAKFRIARSRR
jgi:hypothetical protein